MKKLIFIILLMAIFVFAKSQTIPNSDFENWSTVTLYETPQGYVTTNFQSFINTQSPNVTKTNDSHSGSYAVKLETKLTATDTVFGLITNGVLDNDGLTGGIPYSSRPDTLDFWMKYDIKAGDSGAVFVAFQTAGNFIGIAYYQFNGSSSNYINVKVPVSWMISAVMPDSMVFAVVSSNPDINPVNGSWISLDDVKLDGISLPNGGFETWISNEYEDATYWTSFNFASVIYPPAYVSKSTDSYSGSFAMKISTVLFNNNQDTLAHVTNGRIEMDDFAGGMAVMNNPSKVTGYYKYTPVGNDSALIALRSYGFNSSGVYKNLENNLIKLPAASSFTKFEIPLYYNGWPYIDTLGIAFASSNIYDGYANVRAGSTLIIDSLNIEYQPVGINENQNVDLITVFPNPANNQINFKIPSSNPYSFIRVYNNQGVLVLEDFFESSINTGALSNGIYFYVIENQNKRFHGKFHIIH